jgi:hypothetical protein
VQFERAEIGAKASFWLLLARCNWQGGVQFARVQFARVQLARVDCISVSVLLML